MKALVVTLYVLSALIVVCAAYEVGYVNGALCELTRLPGAHC